MHSPQEHRVAAEEADKGRRAVLDVPRRRGQGEDDADVLARADVDVSGECQHEVVGDGGGVCGDVCGEDGERPAERREEHWGAVHEERHLERVPGGYAVDDLRGGGEHDAEDGAERHEAAAWASAVFIRGSTHHLQGEGDEVGPDDDPGALRVTRKVGN
jgi:hypothetical protein